MKIWRQEKEAIINSRAYSRTRPLFSFSVQSRKFLLLGLADAKVMMLTNYFSDEKSSASAFYLVTMVASLRSHFTFRDSMSFYLVRGHAGSILSRLIVF